ncbi:MAG TPA: sll0787 family AIR synthase-like protein [Polyangiales bacterium]|nr:sll0787 family AIR synthase-like protein [Polyangiales bacterium]
MTELHALVQLLRESKGFAHKRDIAPLLARIATPGNGDDTAVLDDGDGKLLFAIEGFMNELVRDDPWFAGYCGVMVNVSDIYAMGGRPLAVVDALWSAGDERAAEVLAGMREASRKYGVPIVGGHTNTRNDREQLAVAIMGRATKLLSSFAAQPGDRLLAVYDLRGRYREPNAYWDASTGAPGERLRADLELLPQLAEDGLCLAGKDISMGGLLGTTLMLLECARVGAQIELDAIAPPAGVPLARWLLSFPSYGFLLAVDEANVTSVQARFTSRELSCVEIGRCTVDRRLLLHRRDERAELWNLEAEPFIGA